MKIDGRCPCCSGLFARQNLAAVETVKKMTLDFSVFYAILYLLIFIKPKQIKRRKNMTINKISEGEKLTLAISGRLDTNSSPKLEAELRQSVGGVTELVFDFSEVEYISSAGLRVLLAAQKVMNRQGSMKLIGVSDEVMEVFEITGFADILTIE